MGQSAGEGVALCRGRLGQRAQGLGGAGQGRLWDPVVADCGEQVGKGLN